MKTGDAIEKKIMTVEQAKLMMAALKVTGKKVSFTNGCFDILHPGHLFSLKQAAAEANFLIVGLNSDASVRKLKGPTRPINNTESRAIVLANLILVDAVVVFDEETPLELIKALLPDVMVKGGDYTIEQVVGGKEVIANGGKVIINPIVEGFSTTSLIDKMKG
jgi:D-beta-D-heptose 7-phosphate kinase/D-beta-D-heptose 1-phosphate adenosyltransferase